MKQKICDEIMKLYLYADMTKMIHYSTDTNHEHELCDEVRDGIVEFADTLAEQFFGTDGKPSFGDFSLKHEIRDAEHIGDLCEYVDDILTSLSNTFSNKNEYKGIISAIDDFKGDIAKYKFLATFDKLSKY